jgi:hypothetical protein
VFELKGMIETNTVAITETKSTIDDAVSAIAADVAAITEKIADELDSKITNAAAVLDDKVGAARDDVAALQTAVKELGNAQEAQAAKAAQEVSPAAAWYRMANPIHPTNRPASVGIRVLGKNFGQYKQAFNLDVPLFVCTFTNTADNETTVTSGWSVAQPSDTNPLYHEVNCPSPEKQEEKVTFRLSLEWVDSKGAVEIPYNGMNDNDLVLFDMTWSKVEFKDTNVFVDVDGLDQDAKYTCRYTQADNDEIVKNGDAKFVDGSKGFG